MMDNGERILLRPRQEMQSGIVATGVDITSSYSKNSSARSGIDGGTARPSALAVLRSMINSIFVACSTGKCCKSRGQADADSSML